MLVVEAIGEILWLLDWNRWHSVSVDTCCR